MVPNTLLRCHAAAADQAVDAEGDDEEPDEEDIAEGEEEDAAAEAEDDEVGMDTQSCSTCAYDVIHPPHQTAAMYRNAS